MVTDIQSIKQPAEGFSFRLLRIDKPRQGPAELVSNMYLKLQPVKNIALEEVLAYNQRITTYIHAVLESNKDQGW